MASERKKLIVASTHARGEAIARRLGLARREYQLVSPHSIRSIDGLIIQPDDLIYERGIHGRQEAFLLLDTIEWSLIKGGW